MNKKSGFTLLEILVVVLIMTILAGIVAVKVIPRLGEANAAAAAAQIETFRTALKLYRLDNGQYPTQAQGMAALCARPSIPPIPRKYSQSGYLESREVPLDPWGNNYIYLIPGPEGAAFGIISYGADGEPGGDGEATDISSLDM